MDVSPPTLHLVTPHPERSYSYILQQTKVVYDQLLIDKHAKLSQVLLIQKRKYEAKCAELQTSQPQGALEFGVRAQEELNRVRQDLEEELAALTKDYQQKLNNMHTQLAQQWEDEQRQLMQGGTHNGK